MNLGIVLFLKDPEFVGDFSRTFVGVCCGRGASVCISSDGTVTQIVMNM